MSITFSSLIILLYPLWDKAYQITGTLFTLLQVVHFSRGFLVHYYMLINSSPIRAESKKQITLSDKQSDKLLDVLEGHTIEDKPFREGTSFRWVLINFGENVPPGLKGKIIKHFEKYYVVYLRKEDIPRENITTSHETWVGYNNGYSFSLDIKFVDSNTIQVESAAITGNVGAEGATIQYLWNGKDWIIKAVLDNWVS